jgi:Tfp pilus assembly protein PilP
MKKYTLLQAALLAALALVIGLFLGISIVNYSPQGADSQTDYYEMGKYLGGSIGKVDRYRNVQVSEDDILLRNELLDDTAKRTQYEKYLLFYYYKSLKTSFDVDEVLKKTKETEEFAKTYYPYMNALESFKTYLVPAREDILFALNMVASLDENAKVPVIGYLNQAQNAIARINSNESILMNLMNAIISFKDANPEGKYWALDDAHDIISMNLMQSAILTQNKPMLSYLDKKKLLNDKEGVKELVADAQLKSLFQDQFAADAQKLGLIGSEALNSLSLNNVALQDVMCSNEELSAVLLNNDAISSVSTLKAIDQLGIDVQNLGLYYDVTELK